jgi:hypothetical protein
VHVSRGIVFDEDTFWIWNTDGDMKDHVEPFTVEFTFTKTDEGGARASASPLATPSTSLVAMHRTSSLAPTPVAGNTVATLTGTPAPVTYASPPSDDHSRHDAALGEAL